MNLFFPTVPIAECHFKGLKVILSIKNLMKKASSQTNQQLDLSDGFTTLSIGGTAPGSSTKEKLNMQVTSSITP